MADFSNILQAHQILSDASAVSSYAEDRTKSLKSAPRCVLFPESTADVSNILAYCSRENIGVIPSGGRTGLTSATVAQKGEVLLSLDKMNRIIDVDCIGGTINVEAGAILQNVQEAAAAEGLYFPLDFAAKGSCQIGGCISTNAGGVKVLKYGMTRQLVLGLEVVLASGEVLDLNRALVKDNSGYDLKQFFIGAEGTLGVVTKATFACTSPPQNPVQALLAVEKFTRIPQIFAKAKASGLDLLAFEFLDATGVDATCAAMPRLGVPFTETPPFTVLIEVDTPTIEPLHTFLEDLAEAELLIDACVAENSQMTSDFWTLREAVSDSLYLLGTVHANDVSVPISQLSEFLESYQAIVNAGYAEFTIGVFGHIGDGNFHIYVIDKKRREFSELAARFHALDKHMFELVQKLGGSISAEHGIGLLKKDALSFRRSNEEIELMRGIKAVFDPQGILNPSKVF